MAVVEERADVLRSFPLENSGIEESERQADNAAEPPTPEEPDVLRSFPLENSGVVGEDLNARRSFPLENSGIDAE